MLTREFAAELAAREVEEIFGPSIDAALGSTENFEEPTPARRAKAVERAIELTGADAPDLGDIVLNAIGAAARSSERADETQLDLEARSVEAVATFDARVAAAASRVDRGP